jgi:hypothetical protein
VKYFPYGITKDGIVKDLSPKDLFFEILTGVYRLPPSEAGDIAHIAIEVFDLDSNGKLPFKWEELYRHQA